MSDSRLAHTMNYRTAACVVPAALTALLMLAPLPPSLAFADEGVTGGSASGESASAVGVAGADAFPLLGFVTGGVHDDAKDVSDANGNSVSASDGRSSSSKVAGEDGAGEDGAGEIGDKGIESANSVEGANGAEDGESADDDEADGEDLPDYAAMSLEELKDEVDAKTLERDEVKDLLDDLGGQVAENQTRLNEATARLTVDQAAAEHAVSARYKAQRLYPTLVDALLCAQDWQSFIEGIDYIEAASEASVDKVATLRKEVASYEREALWLSAETKAAEKHLERVSAELEAATEARDEAQRKADMVANAHLEPDDADWDSSKDDFVEEWGSRIDEYLEGSPLEGQGDTFAEAAWKNHVDPRFSPAISNIESGKGSVCIRPHNAWGWGAAEPDPAGLASSWSSWEDAINDHVSGLAEGYGYTVSIEGAKKYCPPNWELWYATTVDQMNSI